MSGRRPWMVVFLLGASITFAACCRLSAAADGAEKPDPAETAAQKVTQGALRIVGQDGSLVECPLKHTDVRVAITGFIARVYVTQTFINPTADTIEAVYVFPLPHEAAVDAMTMMIGDRKIVGRIKRRDEARQIYEQALLQGQTAALLEQERPNIFTQSVGNIRPGQEVKIEIAYVDVLKYDLGQYEFYFPMVVGPRFIPGAPIGAPESRPAELQDTVSPPVANTDRVPDAERISPPVLKPEMRSGHDISLSIQLDAGVPIQNLSVANHEAAVNRSGARKAEIELASADSIPNKDFVVRYGVVGAKPEMAVLTHTTDRTADGRRLGEGYFMLMIQPREDERLAKQPPREMVFLVDVSGSMRGANTAKVRETMQHMLGLCREIDTVQVITFASQAVPLFKQPLPVNQASIARALQFTSGLQGGGGTNMLEGVKLAIDAPLDRDRIRIVVMLTDGFIGNEAEIVEHVGQHCGDQVRFWTIGIGQSPNMFLIDGVARQGGGMGKRLGLNDEAEPLATEVMTRIQRAQLAKVTIDWGGLDVAATYPTRLPELWAGRPLIVYGRYAGGGQYTIRVSGQVEGEPMSWPLSVEFPRSEPQHDVLAKVWARQRIEDLMQQSYYGGTPAVEEEVTAIALDYRLMSPYTSFVAVDEQEADRPPAAVPPRRMLVPVPLPEGTQWEGFFGGPDAAEEQDFFANGVMLGKNRAATPSGRAFYGGGSDRLSRMPFGSGNRMSEMMRGGMGSAAGILVRRSAGAHPLPALATPMSGMGMAPASSHSRGVAQAGSVPVLLMPLKQPAVREQLADMQDESGSRLPQGLYPLILASLQGEGDALLQAAQAAWQAATEQREAGNLEAARAAFVRAVFLDQAAANLGRSPGQVAGQALDAVSALDQQQVTAWTRQWPVLGKRLDIVIRDHSVADALQQVAAAAGVSIRWLQGSTEDAETLNGYASRVTYLDLRNATVAQALDWILRPLRLTWRCAGGELIAGADRRMPGRTAWVYDVLPLVTPIAVELEQAREAAQRMAKIKQACEQFMEVLRHESGIADSIGVCWYAPGQVLVIGEPEQHARVARLLLDLADAEPGARLPGAAGKLQVETAHRAQERRDAVARTRVAREHRRIALTHETCGWQLLAAAAAGRADEDAITELAIAWRNPATGELLSGRAALPVWRSLWAVTEAARALPDSRELAALARSARQAARPAIEPVIAGVGEPANAAGRDIVLGYLGLAFRDDSQVLAAVNEALAQPAPATESASAAARLLCRGLLGQPAQLPAQSLCDLVQQELSGNDLVVLAAMACHRAGGVAWPMFRAESGRLLGGQPLSGQVVLLVNRLPEAWLPIASR